MQKDWFKVYSSSDFYKSELLRQALIENQIEAVLVNKQGYPYNIGEVELYVHSQDMDKAVEIIKRDEF
jgi:hypothetical protein